MLQAGWGETCVLVVDDDDLVANTVAELLEDDGYGVLVAFSGAQALMTLEKHTPRPQAVLLDLVMPGGNGWWLLRRLRRDPALRALPVVTMSGLDGVSKTLRGVSTHITKPLDTDIVLDAVRFALARHRCAVPAPRARLW